jgi:hypothetical protein
MQVSEILIVMDDGQTQTTSDDRHPWLELRVQALLRPTSQCLLNRRIGGSRVRVQCSDAKVIIMVRRPGHP